MRKLFRLMFFVMLFSLNLSVSTQQDQDSQSAEAACNSAESELMLAAINQYRLGENLSPLVANETLCDVADDYVRTAATTSDAELPDPMLETKLEAGGFLSYPDGYVAELKVFITRNDSPDTIISTLLATGGDLGLEEFQDYFGSEQYREAGLVHLFNRRDDLHYYVFVEAAQPNILPVVVGTTESLHIRLHETDNPTVQVLLHNERVNPGGASDHVGDIIDMRLSGVPRETGVFEEACSIPAEEAMPFQNLVEYTLSGGLGLKTIYIEMCDLFGAMTVSSVDIILTNELSATTEAVVLPLILTDTPIPDIVTPVPTHMAGTAVRLFIDTDSLTLFVPEGDPVSLEGLTFEVGEAVYPFDAYSTFQGIPLNPAIAPACFRLRRDRVTVPAPMDCPSDLTITQNLTNADVFWFDDANFRSIVVKQDGNTLGVCQGGGSACEIVLASQ